MLTSATVKSLVSRTQTLRVVIYLTIMEKWQSQCRQPQSMKIRAKPKSIITKEIARGKTNLICNLLPNKFKSLTEVVRHTRLSSQTTTCYPSRGTKKESAQSPTLKGQVLRRILMRTLLTTRILTKRTAISSQDLVFVMIRRVKQSKHTLIRRHTSTQAQQMKSMRHLGVGARVRVSLQGKSRHTR